MRILELEIHNVRGIRDTLLMPNGKNILVWGPNGSGKSAVVDAVDFLLTGRITRLTGKGTGGLSLNKHGPHVDCQPEEAVVKAKIKLASLKEPIEISRCMANPSKLDCRKEALPYLEPIMKLAERGQHVLTRREILRYITAEGGTRAAEIQELLNISEVEETRKSLVRVQNDCSRDLQSAQRNLEKARTIVSTTVQQPRINDAGLLDVINRNRAIFGASPLISPTSSELKKGIRLPTAVASEASLNTTLFQNDVANLRTALLDPHQSEVAAYHTELDTTLRTIKADPALRKAMVQQQLVVLGRSLIVDDDTACPLCDTSWSAGELGAYLARKQALAQTATKYYGQLQGPIAQLRERTDFLLASLGKVIATAKAVGLAVESETLVRWQTELSIYANALSFATDKYLELSYPPDSIRRLFSPRELPELTDKILAAVRLRFPEATPERTAWDILTKLEENLKVLEDAKREEVTAARLLRKATLMQAMFQKARDTTLQNLYNDIKGKFEILYRQMHGSDESGFEASLSPSGASLDLEVSFYGRGKHPPHALHSEGHQDSMGLCLYLALAEKLTKGAIELVILDDVVMSVDADHRRELCRLLTQHFPHRQFLITTHDRTWATQLRMEGVVNSEGSVEFYNWNVATGPQINNETTLWEKIEKDLLMNDVPSAAAKLRRGSEQFFGEVCDALQAQVRYKANGRWELGDFMPAAIGKYRSHLKKAKAVAQSWGNDEAFRALIETESVFGQIANRTNVENWAINASVHYNNWSALEERDFRPVLEAFQDLHSALSCSTCHSIFYVTTVGTILESLRCSCGRVNWNLRDKT